VSEPDVVRVLIRFLRAATVVGGILVCLTSSASARVVNNQVVVSVDGPGHVTGQSSVSDVSINCPPTCWALVPFADGATFTLTAVPDPGAQFVGWFTDCASAASQPTCTLSGEHYYEVFARFAVFYPLTVTVDPGGTGTGAIQGGSGLNCDASCTVQVPQGFNVSLSAVPDSGSILAGWDGACSGTSSCAFPMQGAATVSARFADNAPPTVTTVASHGLAGRAVKLLYRVSDNSKKVSLQAWVRQDLGSATKIIGRVAAPLSSYGSEQTLHAIMWTAPKTLHGTLRFCVTASDARGNKSAPSCSPLTLRA
jgi:hypothetical protein